MSVASSEPNISNFRITTNKTVLTMYTEIKEAVNFLASFLFHHIPRRKIGLFCEEFGNIYLRAVFRTWNTSDPFSGQEGRTLYVRRGNEIDKNVKIIAQQLAIEISELIRRLPDNLVLQINPGLVTYSQNGSSEFKEVWSGDVDEDQSYKITPKFVTIWNRIEDPFGSDGTSQFDLGLERQRSLHDHIQLHIVENKSKLDALFKMCPSKIFSFKGCLDQTFLVTEFALTRFGSLKQRPDYDLMRRIQCQDTCATSASLASNSSGFSEPRVPAQFADSVEDVSEAPGPSTEFSLYESVQHPNSVFIASGWNGQFNDIATSPNHFVSVDAELPDSPASPKMELEG